MCLLVSDPIYLVRVARGVSCQLPSAFPLPLVPFLRLGNRR